MRPDEEQELISYLESVIAAHPLRQEAAPEKPEPETPEPTRAPSAPPGTAGAPEAPPEPGAPAEDEAGAAEAAEAAPKTPTGAGPAPLPAAPDLSERGAGLRLLWGAQPPAPVRSPWTTDRETPAPEPPVSTPVDRPETAQTLYQRLERLPSEAVDRLQAVGISRATVARTGVRWTGNSGRYAGHLVFPLRQGPTVRQLQFWPLDATGDELTQLSLTVDEFGPPDGLFGTVPPVDEAVWVTETPLDALSLNEHGFPAVAAFQGLPPSDTTAAELLARTVYLLSADDETGEEWRRVWAERLTRHDMEPIEVLLPTEVDGRIIQGAHDFLRAMPLGFAFADALRRLAAQAERREPESPDAVAAANDSGLQTAAEATAGAREAAEATGRAREEAAPAAGGASEGAAEEATGTQEPPAATGIPELDARLAGGFAPGLAVVAGEPGTGKTALLEDMAIEAATQGRPVLFYCPREGSRSIRERLISRLSRIMDGSPLPLADLQRGSLDEEGRTRLAGLEQTYRLALLPRLTMVDTLPDGPDPVDAFLDELDRRLADRSRARQRPPLVLVDDLQYLLLALKVVHDDDAGRLLLGMKARLARAGSPGVLVSTSALRPAGAVVGGAPASDESDAPLEHLADTLVVLGFVDPARGGDAERLRLDVRMQSRSGWTGLVDLFFHRPSGLFWEGD